MRCSGAPAAVAHHWAVPTGGEGQKTPAVLKFSTESPAVSGSRRQLPLCERKINTVSSDFSAAEGAFAAVPAFAPGAPTPLAVAQALTRARVLTGITKRLHRHPARLSSRITRPFTVPKR